MYSFLARIKVSSAWLLFTSFVKKGKGINRAATALARWSAGSSPHLRELPPSNAFLFFPRSGSIGQAEKTHGSATSNIYCPFFTTRYCQTPLGLSLHSYPPFSFQKCWNNRHWNISEFRTVVFLHVRYHFCLVPRRKCSQQAPEKYNWKLTCYDSEQSHVYNQLMQFNSEFKSGGEWRCYGEESFHPRDLQRAPPPCSSRREALDL